MSELTPKDKAYIRLKCITSVIEAGSRIDANNATNKADEYYRYIIGEKPHKEEKPIEKKRGRPPKVKETKQDTVIKSVPLENSPFGKSEREQVML